MFDDPRYIQESGAETWQNVMPFVFALAGLETIQFVELVTGLGKRGDLGQQRYNYASGELLPERKECADGCGRLKAVGLGDSSLPYTGRDVSKERESGAAPVRPGRRAGPGLAGTLRGWFNRAGRLFGSGSRARA